MRRFISTLILLTVFIVNVCGQVPECNTININLTNGTVKSYLLTEIESVTHEASGEVSVITQTEALNYNVSEISSINFAYQENHSYSYISEDDLEEWDEGICDSNGCFLAYRQESDGGFLAIIGDGKNLESAITMKFDSEFNIESLFSDRGFMSVFVDDKTQNRYYIILSDGNVSVKEIGIEYSSESMIRRVNSSNAVNALNTILDWANNAMTANDLMALFSNGSNYLPGFLGGALLSSSVWGYGKLGGLALSLFLNWAENKYENDYYRLLNDYMGGGNVYISDIDEDNVPKYNIEATIYGLNTIGKPLGCSIHTGIAVKLNDSHVFYDDCDMLLSNHEVNSDSKYTASLEATKGTTYYLRPYLVVMIDGMLTQTAYTRSPYLWGGKPQPLIIYGDVNEICFNPNITATTGGYSDITENSVKVDCTFSKLPKGAVCGVKYSSDGENFSFQTCSSNDDKVQHLTITGLEPMTSYTYFACVEYAGDKYDGKPKSFTTNPPDISGTWNCTQKNWQSLSQSYTEETYTITLHEDGTVTHTSSMSSIDPISGGWTYAQDGTLNISIMDIATQSYNHGIIWEFKTDTPKNPHVFNGAVYGWNFSDVSGYHQGNSSDCTLTR